MQTRPRGRVYLLKHYIAWFTLATLIYGCGLGSKQMHQNLPQVQTLAELESAFGELNKRDENNPPPHRKNTARLQEELQTLRQKVNQLRVSGHTLKHGKRLHALLDRIAIEYLRIACKPNHWLVDLSQIQLHSVCIGQSLKVAAHRLHDHPSTT